MAAGSASGHAPARIIFLGPPGAGKGTQAARVSARLAIPRVSTGDMLREAVANRTGVGRKAAPLMEKGELVPDDLLIEIVRERLGMADAASGYLLDGFPRTLAQAQALVGMAGGNPSEGHVFLFELPRAEVLQRLSGRRLCPVCQSTYHVDSNPPRIAGRCDRDGAELIQRDDDKEAAVAKRLEEYELRTAPLVAFYRGRPGFHRVDAARTVDAVYRHIVSQLGITE